MSRLEDACRLVVGILGGFICGQAATRCCCVEPSAPTDSPLEITQRDYLPDNLAAPDNTHKSVFVSWNAREAADAGASDVSVLESKTPTNIDAEERETTSLGDQIDIALDEMRQLDRLELPERRDVAWRLHSRLCQISHKLDEAESQRYVVPNEALLGKWDGRQGELTNQRSLVRSLLAAIAVAPEKSAFMSKASQVQARVAHAEDETKPTDLVIVGDLKQIKKTDRAWFFQMTDPFNPANQHMVRVDCHRLEQRVPVGSRVVVLGRTVPTETTTLDVPFVATEVYAVAAPKVAAVQLSAPQLATH